MANRFENAQDVDSGVGEQSTTDQNTDQLSILDTMKKCVTFKNGITVTSYIANVKKNPPPDRGQWSSGIEFLLSCISMSIGLGNVWRFPYIAYENGGGAFLIPYLLLLFLVGRPIYYLELIIGQFSGRGPIKMWNCIPALRGVGFAQLFSVSYMAIFYNYLMALSIYYFTASLFATSELPWTICQDVWSYEGFCEQHPNATNYRNQTWPELYYK